LSGLPAAAAAHDDAHARDAARRLGIQLVPKHGTAQKGTAGAAKADPMLGMLTDPSQADMSYWNSRLDSLSRTRSKNRAASAVAARAKAAASDPLLVDEQEPATIRGGNDTTANAQRIPPFGTAAGKRPAARILGTLAPAAFTDTFGPVPEDNGAIPLAGETGVTSGSQVKTSGTIGDGPHGSAGDGTGDFDFYAIRGASAGAKLVVDIDTPTSDLDSVVILWDAAGNPLAANDDFQSVDSLLSMALPAAGDYFVSVVGFGSSPVPPDPFDSGSGLGAGSEGAYDVTFGLDASDVDTYAVNLRAGDVVGGTVTGSATRLTVFDPSGKQVFGSGQDVSGIFPILSPLPGGGNATIDHVATTAGRYYVQVEGQPGGYDVTLEGYRSGPQTRGVTQTIFLDVDGARLNTAPLGGQGVSTLSPLAAFLGLWGIPTSQQDALINRIVATVTENLKKDYAGTGVKVKILNSRDDADPFGQPNVSRLIVGGTRAQAGIDTIGIAQSIDPGNFDTAETALILLDRVSEPKGETYTLNEYLTPASDKAKFVGTALGNVASHEAGHYLGNWHVDQYDEVLNLMDQGGNFPYLYGVGADGVGGTADDPDVDFGEDTLNPNEGFTGLENTRTRTRWGLTP
jgi:hypothetical protein